MLNGKIFSLFFFLSFFFSTLGLAQEVYQAHTKVNLISEQTNYTAGQTVWVGFHMVMDPEWHVYWKNPGDSGLQPKIKWDLPKGVQAGEIQWPYPARINVGPLTSYGYEHEVLLMVPLTIDENVADNPLKVNARLNWLTCKVDCIPGKGEFTLELIPSSTPQWSPHKPLFDETANLLPVKFPGINFQALDLGKTFELRIDGPINPGQIEFFPLRNNLIVHSAKQKQNANSITMEKSNLLTGIPSSIEGIAVHSAGWDKEGKIKAIEVSAPLSTQAQSTGLLLACAFALLGGLILNLMPCVFPVLSIKVINLIHHKDSKHSKMAHAGAFAAGVISSFWVLAAVLFALQSAGNKIGWGFQFQSPVFVLSMAIILFILALNLLGAFEFNVSLTPKLKPNTSSLINDFWSGVLATILGTPCTAPFMGTALAFALTQPIHIGFLIFTFLGAGMALPYVLLCAFPQALAFIPKPGPWMKWLKTAFGIILLACVLWLLWVFALQKGIIKNTVVSQNKNGIAWAKFDTISVNNSIGSGRGVFLDFTAAWCLTCQVNDRTVLSDARVVQAFKDKNIQAFKADWTDYNEEITQALHSYGRNSVPLYVYYKAGSKTPTILPELITEGIILDNLKD